MRLLLTVLMICAFTVPALAETRKPAKKAFTVTESEAKKEDYTPVQRFCMNKKEAEQRKTSSNSNFAKATETHNFGVGEHELDDAGTTLVVYEGGAFLLTLGSKYFAAQGTSYDDYMAGGKQIGGCNAAQMSEAINNNKIPVKKDREKSVLDEETSGSETEATVETVIEPVPEVKTEVEIDPAKAARQKNPKPTYSLPQ